jgi:hypothetical protein
LAVNGGSAAAAHGCFHSLAHAVDRGGIESAVVCLTEQALDFGPHFGVGTCDLQEGGAVGGWQVECIVKHRPQKFPSFYRHVALAQVSLPD